VFEARDAAEGELYAAARRAAIPAVELKGRLLLEDVGVAVPDLPQLIAGVEAIAARNEVTIAFIAHAGDGNTHPLIVFDPDDPDEEARAYRAYGEVMDLAIALGGTITGEHGVGKLKQPWLEAQVGEDVMELSARIKHALDPQNILNPGTIFAL
jgi:glycolate oxidase